MQAGDSSSPDKSPSLDLTVGQLRAGHLHESCPPDSYSELITTDIKEEINNKSNVVVYPNPASNKIEVETSPGSVLEMFNIQGQKIIQQKTLQNKTVLDISSLKNGIYILVLNSNDNTKVTKILKE